MYRRWWLAEANKSGETYMYRRTTFIVRGKTYVYDPGVATLYLLRVTEAYSLSPAKVRRRDSSCKQESTLVRETPDEFYANFRGRYFNLRRLTTDHFHAARAPSSQFLFLCVLRPLTRRIPWDSAVSFVISLFTFCFLIEAFMSSIKKKLHST